MKRKEPLESAQPAKGHWAPTEALFEKRFLQHSRALLLSQTRLMTDRKGTTHWVSIRGGIKLSRMLASQPKNQNRTSMSARSWKRY